MYLIIKGKIPAQSANKLPQLAVISVKKEFSEATEVLYEEVIDRASSYGYDKAMVKDRVDKVMSSEDGQHTLTIDGNSIAEIKTLNNKIVYIYNFIERTVYQLQKTK